jgi:hypothetical protein
MREIIWRKATSRLEQGRLLPWWALCIRCILHPIDFLYWKLSKTRGYQPESDTWLIYGVKYSDMFFRLFSRADGEVYRVTRKGDLITLEHNVMMITDKKIKKAREFVSNIFLSKYGD